ncbi:hypothetical protein MHI43_22360 [Paenibacillus sp. FSL H8-0457]|uniref:hypothetical protein n=1 Tax=Bacillales TaxID=1385 RepID=UPI000178851F|nr:MULTISPECIES: hypothetical protein [Paenibacillus]ACX66637.1 hypothetical protein GYMC10_4412 [Paenibacillus sp. Y412MC10]ETT60813.1 hypothetical protein C172_21018 [Paenibacillus sp. FSL H8-457]MCM3259107.1 hypothetical protein [Paenibacillus lautus]
MKMRRFAALIIIALAALGVVLFGNMMTPRPGSSSGNGNPAILLLIPLSILFLMLVYQWIRLFKDVKLSLSRLSLLILVLIGYIIAGYAYQLHRLEIYREILAEAFQLRWGQTDWDHIVSITSGGLLSIHMNNQFFNWNTYFMMIAFSLLLCFMYKLIQDIMNRRQGTSAEN